MRLHRFYLNTPISGDTFDIADKELVHQWKKVFRYNVGSQVILFDGSGIDYHCILSSIRNLGATASVIHKKVIDNSQRKNVWLCVGLIKKDNFDLVVQKATELGVTNVVPLLLEHSEKKKLNLERMKKIAIEATEQSGRGDVPIIHQAITLDNLFKSGQLPQEKFTFHPEGLPFKQYLNVTNQVSFAVFIGPEGGFSPKEIELFKSYNVPIVSIGNQILRAETAAIAVSSLLIL